MPSPSESNGQRGEQALPGASSAHAPTESLSREAQEQLAARVAKLLADSNLGLLCFWPATEKPVGFPDRDEFFARTPVVPFIAEHSTRQHPLLRPRIFIGVALIEHGIVDAVPLHSPVPIISAERACMLTSALPAHEGGQVLKSLRLLHRPMLTRNAEYAAFVASKIGAESVPGLLSSSPLLAPSLAVHAAGAGIILDTTEILVERQAGRFPDLQELGVLRERCRNGFILGQAFERDLLNAGSLVKGSGAAAPIEVKQAIFAYLNAAHVVLRETVPRVATALTSCWDNFHWRVTSETPQFRAMKVAYADAQDCITEAASLVTDLKILSYNMANSAKAATTDVGQEFQRTKAVLYKFNQAVLAIGRGVFMWAMTPGRDEQSRNYLLAVADTFDDMLRTLNKEASEKLARYYMA